MVVEAVRNLRLAGISITAGTIFAVSDEALAKALVAAQLAAPSRGAPAFTVLDGQTMWAPAQLETRWRA